MKKTQRIVESFEGFTKLNEVAKEHNVEIGEMIGNTVEGFDWEVIKIEPLYYTVKNVITDEQKRTFKDNMYSRESSVNDVSEEHKRSHVNFEDVEIDDVLTDNEGEKWIAIKPSSIVTSGNLNRRDEIYIMPTGESKKVNGSLGFHASKKWIESNIVSISKK